MNMQKSPFTTLCYIEKDDSYLMLHRIKKEQDVNKDKWIGIGGHFETGESPEECLLREVKEETGLTLISWQFRGLITFAFQDEQGQDLVEYMCLYTADQFEGDLTDCEEGELEWVKKEEVYDLPIWEGDRIFFRLLDEQDAFFSLKLEYKEDRLERAVLDGKELELLDIRFADGSLTGQTRERTLAHRDGTLHGTSHVWIVRTGENGGWDLLLQKRSQDKDSFPGCYDVSSAGHIPAGSDFLESAIRELWEELGITATENDLQIIGMNREFIKTSFYGRPWKNYEISAIYLYDKSIELEQLTLQQEEIDSVCWMDLEECMDQVRMQSMEYCISIDELELLQDFLKNI